MKESELEALYDTDKALPTDIEEVSLNKTHPNRWLIPLPLRYGSQVVTATLAEAQSTTT